MTLGKQLSRRADGSIKGRGIQWTDATWPVFGGCEHNCRWKMPDEDIAICYAEEIANKFTHAYPQGFQHHYFREHNLNDPIKAKKPMRIFLDSMSDAMGSWIPEEQLEKVFAVCEKCPQHDFQLLTKDPGRLAKWARDHGGFPDNVWVGCSSPPDFMHDKELTRDQQEKMLHRTLKILGKIREDGQPVTWMSVEPLSWDVSKIVADNPPLSWAVIGAATNGPKVFLPDPDHVTALLEVFDAQQVPVFFKGNLAKSPAAKPWREYFPGFEKSEYMDMKLGPHAVPLKDQGDGLFGAGGE